ncbi:adenosylcobinamide-GDP ribazoletransferase [Lipingzhangella sp. LS1_29]|uniref:Adenosylcobinamide-GDP ribazoletransferase n=1 Tax=Lipingzhangella rawalii TaxID=2055835 RepID=A0ABU2H3S6_9ACTN|nr:adenosylcobinamide-GDP ribazoletransferase [Lipingzhangella rawalii]MDS1269499.1 adenosylcobinamide-GDP ribazoletransferase [Lipingzhangella rawalii]
MTAAWGAGLRLAVGTLTVFPVRPVDVNRTVAGWAMLFAPLAGLLLAVASGILLGGLLAVGTSPLLAAVLTLGLLTVLTRGLHLDGLADLADGLGSARPAEQAVDIMRRSDIGPFGVLSLIFTVAIQAAALSHIAALGTVTVAGALGGAVISGRLAVTWTCRRGVPAGRAEGLGAMVAESVSARGAGTVVVLVLLGCSMVGALATTVGTTPVGTVWMSVVLPLASLGGLATAEALRRHAVRRLGGITGDVLGAVCEVATTATLVLSAVLLSWIP